MTQGHKTVIFRNLKTKRAPLSFRMTFLSSSHLCVVDYKLAKVHKLLVYKYYDNLCRLESL